jgi:hypothetical protein
MSTHRRLARTPALGLALGALALGGCHRSHQPARAAGASPAAAVVAGGQPLPGASAPSAGVAPAGLFGAGAAPETVTRRRYRLDLTATLTAPSAPRGTDLRVSGTWSVTRLGPARDGDGTDLLASLDVRQLEVVAPSSAVISASDYRARVRSDLTRPVLLREAPNGRIVALKAAPGTLASALAVVRSVAAAAQTSRGAAGERTWTAEEDDTAGQFRVRYERAGDRTFTRGKLECLKIDAPHGARAPAAAERRIVASNAAIGVSATGALESVTQTEELVVSPGPELPPLTVKGTTRLALAQEERTQRPDAVVARLQGLEWRPLYKQPPPEAHELEIDLAKASTYASVAAVLAALRGLPAKAVAADGTDPRTRLAIALSALFRLKPQTVDEARRLLDTGTKQTEFIVRALATAGTAPAQRLVLSLLGDEPPPAQRAAGARHPAPARPSALGPRGGRMRGEILVMLCLARHPSWDLVDGLEHLLSDPTLRGQALLGLGSAAFRLQRENPLLAERILHILETQLDEATAAGSFQSARAALRAFGNAGHPEMLGMLHPYLTAPQPEVRAAAVGALRRVDSPQIDELLKAYTTSDVSDDVRSAARATLDERAKRGRESAG